MALDSLPLRYAPAGNDKEVSAVLSSPASAAKKGDPLTRAVVMDPRLRGDDSVEVLTPFWSRDPGLLLFSRNEASRYSAGSACRMSTGVESPPSVFFMSMRRS